MYISLEVQLEVRSQTARVPAQLLIIFYASFKYMQKCKSEEQLVSCQMKSQV